ncbi:MAG: hypothetical protein L7W43_09850, partial [Rubripirellula sp.]|nr:hypothetical protein [Rubripirellula sp.]
MNRTQQRGRGFAIFCLWAVVGTILGMGVAYLMYARQTPLFESVATMKVTRVELGSKVPATESGEFQLQVAQEDGETSDGSDRVLGFRMTDDASQDALLSDSTEASGSKQRQEPAELQDVAPNLNAGRLSESKPAKSLLEGELPDDSLLLCSQAVLERAVELGELDRVQELQWMVSVRDQSPEAFVRAWVNNGSLTVEKSGET